MGDQEVKTKHSEKRKGKHEDSATLNEDLDGFKQKRRKSDDNPIDKKKKRRKETIPEPTVIELKAVDDVTPIEKKKKKHSKSSDTLAEPPMISNGTLQEMALSSEKISPMNTEKKKKKRKRDEDSVALPHLLPAVVASEPHQPQSDISSYMTKHSIKIHTKIDLPPILSFAHLPPSIPTPLRDALNEFSEPTPVQACCWPFAFADQDVVGIAETGSGKTLAFGLPALAHILNLPSGDSNPISVLVIAPTRELAIQTHETLYKLGAPLGIGSVAVFGGVSKEGQVRLLAQATSKQKNKSANGVRKEGGGVPTHMRIIVGTPGRILDLVNDGTCDLSAVSYLVLDEADRMLDKGFENDIRRIIGFTRDSKEGRQTMMFSATWPEAVRRLADSFMRDAVRVTVGSDDLTANSKVEQIVEVFDDARSKDSRLLSHLRTHLPSKSKNGSSLGSADRILIFALYKKEAARLEQTLYRAGYSVGALHGDMHQSARMDALDKFRDGSTTLLVATDVAARGLDIPEVRLVVNYTFPLTVEDYVHRIGRTGRGGRTGKAITFFTGDGHERALAGELAKVLREGGFDCEALRKFPMTIRKKEHGAYGAFFRDDIPVPKGPTKIVF